MNLDYNIVTTTTCVMKTDASHPMGKLITDVWIKHDLKEKENLENKQN